MNVAYYVLAFDKAVDALMDTIGITPSYIEQYHSSTFTLEIHVNYIQELRLGDPISLNCHLLDFDAKRIHYFMYMRQANENYLAATSEQIMMHVNLENRRSSEFPNHIVAQLEALRDAHNELPRPENCGSVIGIRRKQQ
tara:strand:+ start:243 stop:659 length:417 start_codon:yes stop_codon:yes gene_type:complete